MQKLRLFLLLTLSLASGFAADYIQLPLAWMIGPMCAGIIISIAGHAPCLHGSIRGCGQLIIASAVGLYFTPTSLEQTIYNLHYMVGVAITTILTGCLIAFIIYKMTSIDIVTALLSSIPGGPAEMAQLAENQGGNGPLVAISQSLRISLVVTIIPLSLTFFYKDDSQVSNIAILPEVTPTELILLFSAAFFFTFLFRLLKVTSYFFMGPLAASSILSGLGVYEFSIPDILINIGQFLLGASLGISFSRDVIYRAPLFIMFSGISTIFLILSSAAMAYITYGFIGWDFMTMFLATAPGSVSEMSITAKTLEVGVAGVAAFHIVRLFITVPLTPIVFKILKGLYEKS